MSARKRQRSRKEAEREKRGSSESSSEEERGLLHRNFVALKTEFVLSEEERCLFLATLVALHFTPVSERVVVSD